MLRLPVLPNVNGAASELEASKTAKIDSSAIERAIWSAQPRVKLFCCFFMDVFLLVLVVRIMFVIRHLFPEIRDEVPEKFRMAECFTAFRHLVVGFPHKRRRGVRSYRTPRLELNIVLLLQFFNCPYSEGLPRRTSQFNPKVTLPTI